MPLDDFQATVLRVIAKNRTPESPVGGGAAMHAHGWRLSDDIDVFNKTGLDVRSVSAADLQALAASGFTVDVVKSYEGFIEAIVAAQDAGMTNVQWVQYSGMNFFPPVRDEEFGCRLSFIDLAINKVMAAASRRQPRDLLDLRFVGRTTLPLWNALNAVSGKDESMPPLQAVSMIRRFGQYAKGEIEESVILPEGFDAPSFVRRIRSDLDLAERQISLIPTHLYGKVLLNENGRPLADPSLLAAKTGWNAREAQRGAPWPSGPDIDSILVDRMIRHFGKHGVKLWERGSRRPSDTFER